jgi:hypothetical protein
MSTDTCTICVERYDYATRSKITCTACMFECCKTCFKRYITDKESAHLLRCMSCGVEFNRTSLYEAMGPTFMSTTYRDIRQNILFEIEKGFFTATQDSIQRVLRINKLRDEIPKVDIMIQKKKTKHMKKMMQFRMSEDKMSVRDALDMYGIMLNQLDHFDEMRSDEVSRLQREINRLNTTDSSTITNTYILTCPHKDCAGILSIENTTKNGHYQCLVCNSVVCSQCKIEISNPKTHKCDPNILETLKFIENTTKPCPSCKAPIHKIIGCNQMFCTYCKTSFDWRTLRINNGAVHNPHHAQWMRETYGRSREPTDQQCGRELDIDNVALKCAAEMSLQFNLAHMKNGSDMTDYIFEAIRMAVHHQYITITDLSRERYSHNTNEELRMKLLTNDITEKVFKRNIQRIDKANSRRAEMLDIVITYRDALTDIVWDYYINADAKKAEEWVEMYKQVKNLVNYINQCFQKVADVYGSRTYNNILESVR